jgi:hypothetical protein
MDVQVNVERQLNLEGRGDPDAEDWGPRGRCGEVRPTYRAGPDALDLSAGRVRP